MEPNSGDQGPQDNTGNVTDPNIASPPQFSSPASPNPEPTVYQQPIAPKQKRKIPKLAVIVMVLLLLVGGSAAAYLGIIRPQSDPQAILRDALRNTLAQKRGVFNGTFTYENTKEKEDSPIRSFIFNFKGQSDIEQNVSQLEMDITAAGVKLPVELRQVDNSIFFKLGDLGSIKGAVALYNPAFTGVVDEVSRTVSNQWVEIDETLLKQWGADCTLNTSLALTEDDIKLLMDTYQNNAFATIKSTTNEDLNGKAAVKYEIDVDDNKLAEYGKGLKDLSMVKKLKECDPSMSDELDTKELADNDTTPLILWVDKGSKTIAKVRMDSTKQDLEKSNMKGYIEVSTDFGATVNVARPEGAKPLMQLVGELGPVFQGALLGGFEEQAVPQNFNFDESGEFDFE